MPHVLIKPATKADVDSYCCLCHAQIASIRADKEVNEIAGQVNVYLPTCFYEMVLCAKCVRKHLGDLISYYETLSSVREKHTTRAAKPKAAKKKRA